MAKKGDLVVDLVYHGEMVTLPVRDVTMRDEERIEAEYPTATVPMLKNDGGARYPDFTNAEYLAASHRIDRNRKVARIAAALLPSETADKWLVGCVTTADKVERLKDTLQEWQANHLATTIRSPRLVAEDDVQQELEPILPTSAAVTEAN